MEDMIGTNIDSFEFRETIRNVGKQADFEFATYAKKGLPLFQ